MTADLALVWPELILTIGGLITLMLGTFVGDRQVGLYQLAALLTLAAAAAAVTALFGVNASVFSGTLAVDSFGGFAKLLIYAASFIAIIIAPRFFKGGMRAEYPTLILFAALGMGIMASARDLMTEIAGRRPFRLGNIGMRLAVPADYAIRADQHGGVEIDAVIVGLRHADNDIAVMFTGERGKTIRGRAWNRFDERRDLRPVEPAIAGRAHLRRDDEPGAGCRRRPAEFKQPRDVAVLFEHDRFELDGSDLVHARHRRPAGPARASTSFRRRCAQRRSRCRAHRSRSRAAGPRC